MKKGVPLNVIALFTRLLLLAGFCSGQPMAAASSKDEHWVGTWSASPQLTETRNLPPEPGLSNNTLRQVIHATIGGKHLRVRFSNAYGSNPVTMNSVHVALSAGGSTNNTATDRAQLGR